MEEEFVGKWEKLEPLDWERFKSQKLEKWLSPQRLEKIGLKDADKHYADFAKETKQEDLKEQVNEQKGGFRAQKWFGELVMDFRVLCSLQIKGYNKTSVEFTNYKAAQKYGTDVKINALLSTVEVKMMNYGKKQGYISLNGWDSNPCSYVAFIEALDEEYLTFKFAGWLHGNDVFDLEFTPENKAPLGKSFFTAYQEDLNGPRSMLRMLLKVSIVNPYREPNFMDEKWGNALK